VAAVKLLETTKSITSRDFLMPATRAAALRKARTIYAC
jgi:hypothetical protein